MTLVAAFRVKNVPILIGDLLLSGKKQQRTLDLPTVGDTSQIEIFPPDSSKALYGITQKINIINKDLIIGWSGSYLEAKSIISDLKKCSETESYTVESIQNFFVQRKSWIGNKEVAFVGYIKTPHSIDLFEYSYNNCPVYKPKSTIYEEVRIIGSGYYDMEDLLEKVNRQNSEVSKKLDDFDNAVISALAFCGWFFGDEMRLSKKSSREENDRTLFYRYGGGYEIAIYTENGFQKLNEISYFYWIIQDVNDEPTFNIVTRGFKLSYIDEILFICRIDIETSPNTIYVSPPELEEYTLFTIANITPYHIPPIYREISEDKIEEILTQIGIKTNSEFNCNYIFAERSGSVVCKPYRSKRIESNYIQCISKDGKCFLAVDNSYLDYLRTTFDGTTNF